MAEARTEKLSIAAQIKSSLKSEFPFRAVRVKKKNPVAWWVRIVDPRFAGLNLAQRDNIVRPLLDVLPEEIQRNLTGLLMLTPEELATSPGNWEFEHRSW